MSLPMPSSPRSLQKGLQRALTPALLVLGVLYVLFNHLATSSTASLREELAAQQLRARELAEVVTGLRMELDDARSASACDTNNHVARAPDPGGTLEAPSAKATFTGFGDIRVVRDSPIRKMMSMWPLTFYGNHAVVVAGGAKEDSEDRKSGDGFEGCRRVDVVAISAAHYPPTDMNWAPGFSERCVAVVRTEEKETGHKYAFVRKTEEEPFALMAHYYDSRPHTKATPGERAIRAANELQTRFLKSRSAIEAALTPVLQRAAAAGPGPYGLETTNPRVVVTVSNEGHADLLLNMVCSARINGVDLSNLVVFAAQKGLADALTKRGIHAFYSSEFGVMPAGSETAFGSTDFTRMMWLKVLAVLLPLGMGYDVLFVDDDLVWWRGLRHLFDVGAAADADVVMQDDGSRRNDFAPLYGNTGLYLVRSNQRTKYFMRDVFNSYDLIMSRGTHQGVFDQLLDEHAMKTGLRAVTLSEEDLPAGRIFNKGAAAAMEERILQFLRRGEKPKRAAVIHVNWTGFKREKLERLKASLMWFLTASCEASMAGEKGVAALPWDIEHCCIRPIGVANATALPAAA